NGDLAGKVLVPLLGEHYGLVLERGELTLAFEADSGRFVTAYHEHRLPIDPREACAVLLRAHELLAASGGAKEASEALAAIADRFAELPSRATGAQAAGERARDADVLKQQLARLVIRHAPIGSAIDAAVQALNARSP